MDLQILGLQVFSKLVVCTKSEHKVFVEKIPRFGFIAVFL